jgi:hypothetical protein
MIPNPFLLSPDERLANWRDFRKSIIDFSDEEKFQAVVDYWSHAPLQNIAYDIEDIENFPTPWEMVHAGEWCRNSIAVGMEFTLRLAGIDASRLELRMIIDPTISDMMLTVFIDNKYILNYDWGNVYTKKLSKDARNIKKIIFLKDQYKSV